VACPHPQEALEEIEKLTGVKHAALFGNLLHVVADNRQEAEEGIERLLAGKATVEPIAPSLEDVFVSLIEAKDRETP